MTASRLRVAIIGAGKMARHHAIAIARSGLPAQVVAVADPRPDAREAMREAAPGAQEFDSLDALLSAMPVDVAHIVTPPDTHEAIARQAIEAGCHVYVEKPFADSAAAAKRLLDLAAQHGRLACAGHQLLFEPPALEARELLPTIGRLVHVESYFSFRPVRRNPDGRAPQRTDLQFLDILPHPIYLLLEFLPAGDGSPAEVTGLDIGPAGTVHALVRRGGVTGSLTVTLAGRPVESYLRLVGRNGCIYADFVRGTVQRLIGPGTSGIDKALNPYRSAWQTITTTTAALTRRVLKRQTSYPGLTEIFEAFYGAIMQDRASPLSPAGILDATQLWERVKAEMDLAAAVDTASAPATAPSVLVTGGNGFLGRAVVQALTARGVGVRSVSRREPAPWERLAGADYMAVDVATGLPSSAFHGIQTVIHCAAETAGGWEEHQRNSIDATERVIRGAAAAGVRQVVHVSSIAVVAARSNRPVDETTPLEPDPKSKGPYVWGKLESERLALALGAELGVNVKVARPGAIVDYADFDPPGRVGKRIGPIFVAAGNPGDRIAAVDLGLTARTLAWMALAFEEAPTVLNIMPVDTPTRRDLVRALRRSNPDVVVLWLPTVLLRPLSWFAILAQKLLRPRRPALDAASAFAAQAWDASRLAALLPAIDAPGGRARLSPPVGAAPGEPA